MLEYISKLRITMFRRLVFTLKECSKFEQPLNPKQTCGWITGRRNIVCELYLIKD